MLYKHKSYTENNDEITTGKAKANVRDEFTRTLWYEDQKNYAKN